MEPRSSVHDRSADGPALTVRTGTRALALLTLLAALFCSLKVHAHAFEGEIQRTIVLERSERALRLSLRSPAPLLFSDVLTAANVSGEALESPFLRFEEDEGEPRYRLALERVSAEPEAFEAQVNGALEVLQFDRPVQLELTRFRIGPLPDDTRFASPQDARRALERPSTTTDPWFDDALVELTWRLRPISPTSPLSLLSVHPQVPLLPGASVDNHIVDARDPQAPAVLKVSGQLTKPVFLDGSRWSAALTFVWQGVVHILDGLDHVLFVVCLSLAASSPKRLLWVISGFTVGHSITLIGGFLGYRPNADWFVPAVEAGIAATILYAVWDAWRQKGGEVFVTALIGLLHGFGFSFVLHGILGPGSQGLLASLLAFNVGVEVGQLVIVIAVLLTVASLRRVREAWVAPLRQGVLGLIALVALYWLVERTLVLL